MKIKFSPATQADLIIAELPFDETFNQITDEDFYTDIRIARKTYRVNMGSSRLKQIKKSPICACCGVKATDCSLDLDAQQTKDTGKAKYHVNFYARTGEHEKDQQHMIIFTKDHVIARSKGGSEEEGNYQTLCFNCNTLKDSSDMDLEHMRKAMFPAYRAYQSSKALNLARERLAQHYNLVEKNLGLVRNLTQALTIVTDHRAEALKDKRDQAVEDAKKLQAFIHEFEREAQVTGTVPELDNARGITEILSSL
jgi:hypothetical protein